MYPMSDWAPNGYMLSPQVSVCNCVTEVTSVRSEEIPKMQLALFLAKQHPWGRPTCGRGPHTECERMGGAKSEGL